MLAGQADPFGYRTAGRCLLKGKQTPWPGTAGVAPRCAHPTRAHREKLDRIEDEIRAMVSSYMAPTDDEDPELAIRRLVC